MSGLFIELYLDEDVDVLVADLLRGRGFEATTARAAGQLGTSDSAQLAYAAGSHKTLLTHNRRDFERLAEEYVSSGRSHCGIILATRKHPQEIVRRLLLVLNRVTPEEIQDQIRYI
ncbi:MAG TPA: DUF5615 family PIN-like protein [Thermoanaerobaculia bacterium]|nr:DUF5615 family PIN-like protein [Thermoanaerobaculia bacterium]